MVAWLRQAPPLALLLAASAGWLGAYAQSEPPEDRETDPYTQRGIVTVPAEPGEEAGAGQPTGRREFDRTPVLPTVRAAGEGADLGEAPRVFVRRVMLEGSSVPDSEAVARTTAPFEGRAVTIEELNDLRNRLSLLYFDAGYVNSGVVLPDQDVTDGIIVYREALGRVTQVNLEGNEHLNNRWWLGRLGGATDGVLQINELQATLQVLEQAALVQRIEARLTPGLAAGEGVLDVHVYESSPWRLEIGADNHRSPSLGGEQLTVRAEHLSLTGRGDRLEAYGHAADGLGDGGVAYTLPLGPSDTAVRTYWSGGDADITEAPFDIVNIQSRTWTWGAEFSHPLRRTPDRSLIGFLGVEARHSESTLLDVPFSFSLGEIDGEADTSVVRAGVTWTHRDDRQVLALQLSARYGTGWFQAAVNPVVPPGLNGPKTEFLSLRGQAQWVRRLGWRESELHVRGGFQIASDPLLPVEKMPIGGAWSVRGYRENLLVRDNALTASAEWRLPLFPEREPRTGFDPRAVTVAAFADYGQSRDQDTGLPSDDSTRIYSVGLGVLWAPYPRLAMQVYRGEALNDGPGIGDDPQDEGWHWQLSYRVF